MIVNFRSPTKNKTNTPRQLTELVCSDEVIHSKYLGCNSWHETASATSFIAEQISSRDVYATQTFSTTLDTHTIT